MDLVDWFAAMGGSRASREGKDIFANLRWSSSSQIYSLCIQIWVNIGYFLVKH